MNELERFASELRAELGSPPDRWARGLRERLRAARESERPRRRSRILVASLAAASFALVAALFALLPGVIRPDAGSTIWLAAESSPKPYRTSDGSTVSLRPGARGRLATVEETTHFDLHQGTGLFDVTPRRDQRWRVIAGDYEIAVVGTRFSVRYDPPSNVEVHVEHGIVAVRAPGRGAPISLHAGDRLRANPKELVLANDRAAAPPVASAAGASLGSAEPPDVRPLSPAPVVLSSDWERLYRERRYAASLAAAKQAGFDRLVAALPARALADLADAARLGGDSGLALRALAALQRRFPGSPQAADSRFLVGRVHAGRGESDQAIARFEEYLRGGGRARYSLEATGRLIELYSARGDAARARTMAERYLERAPNGPYKRLALSALEKR